MKNWHPNQKEPSSFYPKKFQTSFYLIGIHMEMCKSPKFKLKNLLSILLKENSKMLKISSTKNFHPWPITLVMKVDADSQQILIAIIVILLVWMQLLLFNQGKLVSWVVLEIYLILPKNGLQEVILWWQWWIFKIGREKMFQLLRKL